MEVANRKITFFGPKPSRAIQRTIQTLLYNWMERKKAVHSIEKEGRYEVQFEHNPTERKWFCLVRIQIGTCTWECQDVGRSVQESLCRALKHPSASFIRLDGRVKYLSSTPEILNIA